MSRKKILIYISLAILLLLIGYGVYSAYKSLKKPAREIFSVIPNDALFVLEINNLQTFCANAKENALADMLLNLNAKQECILTPLLAADSIFANDKVFQNTIIQNKIYVAGFFDSTLHHLFYVNIPKHISLNDVKKVFEQITDKKIQKIKGKDYPESLYQFSVGNKNIYFHYNDNLVTIGESLPFILHVHQKVNTNPHDVLQNENSFLSLLQTSGKQTDANFYLHYPCLAPFLQSSPELNQTLSNFNTLSDWVAFDMNIRNNELLLNGFSNQTLSFANFLYIYNQQTPQPLSVFSILPDDASMCLSYNFDNYQNFSTRYHLYLDSIGQLHKYTQLVENIKNKYQVNIAGTFNWIGKEISLFKSGNDIFTAIECADSLEFLNSIAKIENIVDASEFPNLSNINKINITSFLPVIFQPLPNTNIYYYSYYKGYLIFSDSDKKLERLKNDISNNRLYKYTAQYNRIKEQINDQSSIFLLADLDKTPILKSPLKTGSKPRTFFYQVSCNNEVAYTSCYLNNPNIQIPANAIASTTDTLEYLTLADSIDTNDSLILSDKIKVICETQSPIRNIYSTQSNNDLVFIETENNKLLAYDINGTKKWEYQADSKLLSTIHQVKYLQKNSFLFNTSNKIYLLDVDGKSQKPYPIALNPAATNGIAIFDYDKDNNYRILYAGKDNYIYNINIKGQNVDGWKKAKIQNKVDLPIQHVITNAKDFLVISGKQGVMSFLDRKGYEKVIPKRYIEKNENTLVYADGLNFVTTGKKGSVIKINTDGLMTVNTVRNTSNLHYFFYEDFTGDGKKEYIFAEGNKISVYGLRNTLIFERTLPEPVKTANCYKTSKGIVIAIIGSKTQNVSLFNAKGPIKSALKSSDNILLFNKGGKNSIVGYIGNKLILEEL